MLNVFFRHTASATCVRIMGLACACMLWAPAAQAVETQLPEQAASSPFKQYQSWRDEPLQNWREANDRVGEIGGWRAYLHEAQQGGDEMDNRHHDHHGH